VSEDVCCLLQHIAVFIYRRVYKCGGSIVTIVQYQHLVCPSSACCKYHIAFKHP